MFYVYVMCPPSVICNPSNFVCLRGRLNIHKYKKYLAYSIVNYRPKKIRKLK